MSPPRYLTAPALLLLTVAACARRPVLSSDEGSNHLNEVVAQRNIDDCMRRGQQYVSTGHHTEPIKPTENGIGAGAKTGGTPGPLQSLFSRAPDPVYAGFVDRCLRQRGYEPIGWK
jgi:hypothetical protein